MRPVSADIDLSAIRDNVAILVDLVAPARVCAVVKADGYGHGAVAVSRAALDGGAHLLGVALVAEGAELRGAGIDAPVLVLSQASVHELDQLVANRLEATVYTPAGVADLGAAAARAGRGARDPVAVHLKVDTGMRRVGAPPAEIVGLARAIVADPGLRLASVFTHFAVADEPDDPFTAEQVERYEAVLADLEAEGIEVPCRHAANSAGALAHPEARFDLVRLGIVIYGLAPSADVPSPPGLRPAMALRARVSHVKRVAAGEGISYGLRYRTPCETTVATVPLGYADGVPRRLSATGGEVLVGGGRRPIAGTITMDQFLVDCGDLPVAVGDEVVLIGSQGDATITAEEWADRLGTIAYEIICGVSPRVPRRHREDAS